MVRIVIDLRTCVYVRIGGGIFCVGTAVIIRHIGNLNDH